MAEHSFTVTADFIRNNLRMRTNPVAVKFLKDANELPEKSRRPAQDFGKRVALCQAVSMSRMYGWTIGLTREDIVCVPAAIAFGFSDAEDSAIALTKLFCVGNYSRDEAAGHKEAESMMRLEKNEYEALAIAPLQKAAFDPDTVVFYGNPAQIMRCAQAWSYLKGERVAGNFGGKVECSEYLLAPFKEQKPRIAIPGMGDRVFSMTQDDELVFALPGSCLVDLVNGLQEAGSKVGAQYPVPFFLAFQPEFPNSFKKLGKEVGIL